MSQIIKKLKGTLIINMLDPKIVDLYLPNEDFNEIVQRLGTNKITVVLRTEIEKPKTIYTYRNNI